MKLTRRDVVVALAAGGVAGGGTLAWNALPEETGLTEHDRETLVAVARTVYPTEVSGIRSFVESYVVGRTRDRPERAAGIRDAVAALDEHANHWYDADFVDLDRDARDDALHELGVDVSEPMPDGTPVERVRYYLVNELQFALYTTPTGGELVGIENPQGYPGGIRSYRLPPDSA